MWFGSAYDYWVDAWQRSVLALDALRERGNTYLEHSARNVPHVLSFNTQLVLDGRRLPRPVNYLLARIIPPDGVTTDPAKPPFIVVDPRAGHGPGIGGMKQDSEIGVALAAGHPCYFVGFLPDPVPGQTVEDVCVAEAAFVREVAARHREAEGKPVIIANCQAGWQIMMMAAVNPDLAGPILLAGSPLSYWAGVRGKNPLRYLGGLLGGTWLTALAGDMGHGIFDGAHLVANFESLNPANTYWQKAYNVYSNIDTETARFLDFETWWGSPVLLNAGEMQWIADNLFVGNKLATGQLHSSDGTRIDLRNIKSPIIVFCSWGDNITPPQQALGWITDLYEHEREIAMNGQTIVYTLHQTIGHLGIFVSGKVATKEHGELAACMDMIDLMPPGLYEAVITEVEPGMANPQLIGGKYLLRLEARTLDDIRALGANSPEDDLRFATAARVSEINKGLYRTMLEPAVRAAASQPAADALRQMHPNRARFAIFSDRNPMMQPIRPLAEAVRKNRQSPRSDNPLLAWEKSVSTSISDGLKAWGEFRDAAAEMFFLNTYGSPLVQALVGLDPRAPAAHRRVERDLVREAAEAQLRADLDKRFEAGGQVEAAIRALIYVCRAEGSADERGFAVLKAMRAANAPDKRVSLVRLKQIMKEQFLLVALDEARALRALPGLLPNKNEDRTPVMSALRRMLDARGGLSEEGNRRLRRIETMLGVDVKSQTKASADV